MKSWLLGLCVAGVVRLDLLSWNDYSVRSRCLRMDLGSSAIPSIVGGAILAGDNLRKSGDPRLSTKGVSYISGRSRQPPESELS